MNPAPRVAVVIPLYNHARYIGAALRSVLDQTRPPDRVIVIDDGSSDGSADAARAVADPRITVIGQPNAGAHVAINRAVTAAGDAAYVGILNSDDLYEPARIERCLLELERQPGAALAVTRMRIVGEDGTLLPADEPRVRWLDSVWQARPASLAAWLGVANITKTTSNVFARAEYLRAHPMRPYRYVHDYFLAVTAAVGGRLAVVDEELLRYRVHGANTIKSGAPEALPREVIRMNLDLLRSLAPELAGAPDARARLADYFRALARNYADFRVEPFLHLVAGQFARLTDAEVEALCANLEPGEFPELVRGKSRALRADLAEEEYRRLLQSIAASRWLALGRVLGLFAPHYSGEPDPGRRLAALRRHCARAAWHRWGRAIGFVHDDPGAGAD